MNQINSLLNSIGDRDLEHLIAEVFEAYGWSTTVTPFQGDKGIDVIAKQEMPVELKLLIQVKNFTDEIQRTQIQKYASLKLQEDNVNAVVIVTTSEFSSNAKSMAKDMGVILINNNRLKELINNKKEKLLPKYKNQDISSQQSKSDENIKPGLNSDVKIEAQASTVDISLSLLGFTEIDVVPITKEVRSDKQYQPTAFIELHNRTNAVWTFSPNPIEMVDTEGYLYEPDWMEMDSRYLPARWIPERKQVEPGEKMLSPLIFGEMRDDARLSKIKYEESLHHALYHTADVSADIAYDNVELEIEPTQAERDALSDVDFVLKSGEIISDSD